MPRRLLASAAAVIAALSLVHTAEAEEPLTYVALGDSYSAGSGVLPVDLTAPLVCLQSTRNYPHVIAAETGARLDDVTCGGANTSHFTTAQYPGVAPQLDAVGADTDLITMTIGGNDSGVFGNAITTCGSAALLTLGHGSPCKDQNGSRFEDTVRTTTYPSLVAALRATKAKAPQAEVAILGYPWIVPTSGGCFPILPIATGDVPYLRSLQATLNDAVRRAAAETGVTYVDLAAASDGHDACKPLGVRWIEPIVPIGNLAVVHPNAFGERRMADETMRVLGL